MEKTKIKVSIDQRINVGDFEGFSNPVEISATLQDGDDAQQCILELYEFARKVWAKNAINSIGFYRGKCSDSGPRRTKEQFNKFNNATLSELNKITND